MSWRRRRSHNERPGDVPDVVGSSRTEEFLEWDAAWTMLRTLSPRQRAVLVLRYSEALPDREIAVLLSCTEGTVRSNASRAFAALRRHPDLAHLVPSEATT